MATIVFDHIDATRDPMLRSGKGIVGHVIRTGEVVVAADVSRALLQQYGSGASRS